MKTKPQKLKLTSLVTCILLLASFQSNAQWTGTGPVTTPDQVRATRTGSDVSANSGGTALFGNPTGGHIAIDTDDIQKKSSATGYSILYLNYYGGNINLNNGGLYTNFTNKSVGIGHVTTSERLDVNGGIKLGTALNTNAGTMQWDGSNFQGYNGSAWVNLDGSGAFTSNAGVTKINNTTDDFLVGTSMTGAGTKLLYDAGKSAFRGGNVAGTNWNIDSLGVYSFAYGNNVKAKGNNSMAVGFQSKALGNESIAVGNGATASGTSSTALGNGTTASGSSSTALGLLTTASGNKGATAFGDNTTASGNRGATALGYSSTASGNFGATALGYSTTASGNTGATALGILTTASGNNGATALGFVTTATGNIGATAIGADVSADTTTAITIGQGLINHPYTKLSNNVPNSLMMGFNSDIPTFFIGQANGAGTTGHVGIATTTPSEKLHINGGLRIAAADSMYAGTMQWDGSNFQGYNGSAWVNLDDAAGGSSVWSLNGNKAFYNTGNVGIGTNNPTAKLQVTGDVAVAGSIIHPSDKNLKENIQTLNNGLSLINQLNPTTYNHKAEKATEFGLSTKLQYGLIAQEVEKVLPELVIQKALLGENGEVYKGLDYEKLITILIAALQEADKEIDEQNQTFKNHQTKILHLTSHIQNQNDKIEVLMQFMESQKLSGQQTSK